MGWYKLLRGLEGERTLRCVKLVYIYLGHSILQSPFPTLPDIVLQHGYEVCDIVLYPQRLFSGRATIRKENVS